jgi:hypothetical protein
MIMGSMRYAADLKPDGKYTLRISNRKSMDQVYYHISGADLLKKVQEILEDARLCLSDMVSFHYAEELEL